MRLEGRERLPEDPLRLGELPCPVVVPAQIVERHGFAVSISGFALEPERALEGRQDLPPGVAAVRESHSHPVQRDAQPTAIPEGLQESSRLAEVIERPRRLAQGSFQGAEIAQRLPLGDPVAQGAL